MKKMSRVIAAVVFALLLSLVGFCAAAESGVGGSVLTWMLEDGVLTISGEGAMTNYSSESTAPWELHKLEIKTVVIEEGVTSVGSYAFYGCENLESVDLPEGLTEIGEWAFGRCRNLKSADLPEGLTEIGGYAFHNSGLEGIEIPETVTEIGNDAFNCCYQMMEV